jgi:hypothetical protein
MNVTGDAFYRANFNINMKLDTSCGLFNRCVLNDLRHKPTTNHDFATHNASRITAKLGTWKEAAVPVDGMDL